MSNIHGKVFVLEETSFCSGTVQSILQQFLPYSGTHIKSLLDAMVFICDLMEFTGIVRFMNGISAWIHILFCHFLNYINYIMFYAMEGFKNGCVCIVEMKGMKACYHHWFR